MKTNVSFAISTLGSIALALLAGCAVPAETADQSSDAFRGRPSAPAPAASQKVELRVVTTTGIAPKFNVGGEIEITNDEIILTERSLDDTAYAEIRVKKTSDFENFCHERTIKGSIDRRPVDGLFEEIIVIDRSHTLPGRPCTTGAIDTSVTVNRAGVSRQTGGEIKGTATLVGGPLAAPAPATSQKVEIRTVTSTGIAPKFKLGGEIEITKDEIVLTERTLEDTAYPEIRVKKTSDFENFCHERTIKGSIDRRPVDGLFQEIIVIDRSHTLPGRPCTTGAIDTSVTLNLAAVSRQTGGEIKGTATFQGGPLAPSLTPHPLVVTTTCSARNGDLKVEFSAPNAGEEPTNAKLYKNDELVADYSSKIPALVRLPPPPSVPVLGFVFKDVGLADAGYVISYYASASGKSFVRIGELNIAGTSQIGELNCRAAR